jgi:hypothetical protein
MTILTSDTREGMRAKSVRLELATAVVAAVGVISLLLWRNDTLFFHPQLWAEDSFIYFLDNRTLGIAALIEPYNGYVQICCRIIASIAGLAPASLAPRIYESAFIGAIFLTAFLIYTSPTFKGWGKTFATLALVGAPATSEVFLGMCYTQWLLAPTVALSLYEAPTSRLRACVLVACFALVGFSSPFVLIAAPFVALKLARERTPFAVAVAGMTAANAFFHLHSMIDRFGNSAQQGSLSDKLAVSATVLYGWLFGARIVNSTAAAIVAVLSAVSIVFYLWANRRIAGRPVMYFFCYGVALLMVGCGAVNPDEAPNQWGNDGRYFYVPIVLVIWTFVAIEQQVIRRAWTLPVAAAGLATLFAANVQSVSGKFGTDSWTAAAKCLKESATACVWPIVPLYLRESVSIPSDVQLKTLERDELRKFRWHS